MSDEDQWWFEPMNARRFHIFEGDGPFCTSLCGNWASAYGGYEDPVMDDDEFEDGTDCKSCSREAGILNEDGE